MENVAVITGTTHGIGRVTSRELARAGLGVILLCRNIDAAQVVRQEILASVPGATLEVIPCDLGSLQSVRNSAALVRKVAGSIRLLINNAGIVSARHRMSVDGFELTFATNHLGPFLLTELLSDRLDRRGGRIVNVASVVHYRGRMKLDDLRNPRAPYLATSAYARSKLANVLHTFALARRLVGSGVTANCVHPGIVSTNLLPRWLELIRPLIRRSIFDSERGARTTLHVALEESLAGRTGLYFDEHQRMQTAAPLANDVELQEMLWRKSAEWVGMPR